MSSLLRLHPHIFRTLRIILVRLDALAKHFVVIWISLSIVLYKAVIFLSRNRILIQSVSGFFGLNKTGLGRSL